ncbi:(Trans)glycosidase [Glarea lozoyensis ATCC 20868]|uniref:chitinase n=1 Tax=Glarea lozoyensis (strain ATCC 20868 / MF5171) TaxID=1116229 RepID=S3CWY6_GLAL2|nr:(Trans)glycosidase [Glarea lozoyensis ATCC 20868]EPE29459.1 (Trans)glycosidase [Glarea lozoyensis ATCC 20868]
MQIPKYLALALIVETNLVQCGLIPLLTPDFLGDEAEDTFTDPDSIDVKGGADLDPTVFLEKRAQPFDSERYVFPPSRSIDRFLGRRHPTTLDLISDTSVISTATVLPVKATGGGLPPGRPEKESIQEEPSPVEVLLTPTEDVNNPAIAPSSTEGEPPAQTSMPMFSAIDNLNMVGRIAGDSMPDIGLVSIEDDNVNMLVTTSPVPALGGGLPALAPSTFMMADVQAAVTSSTDLNIESIITERITVTVTAISTVTITSLPDSSFSITEEDTTVMVTSTISTTITITLVPDVTSLEITTDSPAGFSTEELSSNTDILLPSSMESSTPVSMLPETSSPAISTEVPIPSANTTDSALQPEVFDNAGNSTEDTPPFGNVLGSVPEAEVFDNLANATETTTPLANITASTPEPEAFDTQANSTETILLPASTASLPESEVLDDTGNSTETTVSVVNGMDLLPESEASDSQANSTESTVPVVDSTMPEPEVFDNTDTSTETTVPVVEATTLVPGTEAFDSQANSTESIAPVVDTTIPEPVFDNPGGPTDNIAPVLDTTVPEPEVVDNLSTSTESTVPSVDTATVPELEVFGNPGSPTEDNTPSESTTSSVQEPGTTDDAVTQTEDTVVDGSPDGEMNSTDGLDSSIAKRSIFNPSAKANVAVYYGQTPATAQYDLLSQCSQSSIDIIVLAFITGKTAGNKPTYDFGLGCSDTVPSACTKLAADINKCQRAYGKKILIAIGGATGRVTFSNDAEARAFGNAVWDTFGTVSAKKVGRPFGNVVVDGFDFDNETGNPTSYLTLSNTLRSRFPRSSASAKRFYLSAGPQCPYPDASNPMDMLLTLDFVFVQFYNNPSCEIGSAGFQDSLKTWSLALSRNGRVRGPRVMIGAPSWPPAGPTAYNNGIKSAKGINAIVASTKGKYANLGGLMFWDGPEGTANVEGGRSILGWAKNALLR